MKDASSFNQEKPLFLVLGTVVDQHRPNLTQTIQGFKERIASEAQAMGGQLHEECSTVVLGRWDVALYVSVPSPQAIFALMDSVNKTGRIRTETYPAYPIGSFAQLTESAWTRTGAKSPVER